MSSVIKLKVGKKNSPGLKVKNIQDPSTVEFESESEFLRRQEEEKKALLFEEGKNAARAELESIYSDSLSQKYAEFDSIVNSIAGRLEEYATELDNIIIKISFMIAERIIRREIETKSEIQEVIKESVKKVIGANDIIVKLSKNDYENVKAAEELALPTGSYANIKFEMDEKIEQGGCLIESEIGNVDARLSTQMEAIYNAIDSQINANV